MKRFLALMLAVMLLVGMIPATTLAASKYASVIGGWLRLRDGASFDAETITSYYTGTVVEILGTSGEWYRVKTPDGRLGYMYNDYLELGAQSSGSANAYVTSHNGYGVRLRKGPGTGYRIIRTYAVGTPVTVLEKGNYWSRISINGTVGYMMTQFLNFGQNAGNGNESVLGYATIWSSNGYGVRLRTGPDKSYGKIGVYSVGTTVAVLERGKVWDRIRVGSRTGWMMNEFLHYQNANELTSVTLNTMNPKVGTVMSVKATSPANATVSHAWIVGGFVKGTSATYTVTADDVGKTIQLKVNATGSYTGSAVSDITKPVLSNTQISDLTLNTTAPVVGDQLEATFTPADATVAYAWKVDGYQASNGKTYTVGADDVGKVIELIVTGTGQYSGTLNAFTAKVVATKALTGVIIRNDSNDTVGAAPMVGDQLTAVVSPAQATVTYLWKRNGQAIEGADKASYTLTDADLGAQMSVNVTGTGVYSGEKAAAVEAAVAARPVKPAIDEYDMPDAMVGKTFATQLVAQGGGAMKWTLTEGKLPDGLDLSETGAITGTPVKDGAFTFTVQAANAAGTDTRSFTITVVPVAKPELSIGSLTIPAVFEGYDQPAPAAVTITNVGKADAELKSLYTTGDSFIVNINGSSVIKAGETDTTWTVQPKADLPAGTYQANFIVEYKGGRASAEVMFTVNAKAEGGSGSGSEETPETPKVELNVEAVTIPTAEEGYEQPVPVAVSIKNAGNADAHLTELYTIGGNADSFDTNQTGSTVIKAGETDTTWTVQPVAGLTAGTYMTTFQVDYEGGSASATVTFTVTAKQTDSSENNGTTTTPDQGSGDGTPTNPEQVGGDGNATTPDQGSGDGTPTNPEQGDDDGTTTPPDQGSDGTPTNPEQVDGDGNTTPSDQDGDNGSNTENNVKKQLEKPTITWASDGKSVSWTTVSGADQYEFYRQKISGETTYTTVTSLNKYTFEVPGVPGDIFFVRALDSTGAAMSSDYAEESYQ